MDEGPHDHGRPFAWDPDASRASRGRRLIVVGLVLIVLGALLWWLGAS